MTRARILVTGAGGTLGGRFAELLSERHDVIAARHTAGVPDGLDTVPLDLLSEGSAEIALDRARPDAVLHAAALADPDRCEREPGLATALNTEATGLVARLARRRGLRLVAVSTDLVFPGDRPGWREADSPVPLQVYGRTKLAGEAAARAEDPGCAVARVSLILGRGFGSRPTASESVAWSLAEGRAVRLYTDQFRTPVDAESAVRALEALLLGQATGLFHIGGPERVSRYEIGLRTARLCAGDAALIEPVEAARGATGAVRPDDVSLDCGRAHRELGWTPRPLDDAIRESRARRPAP